MYNSRVSNEELIRVYQEQGTLSKAAAVVGLNRASIGERLKKLGITTPVNVLTDDEKLQIKIFYEAGFLRADGTLDSFCKALGRTKPFVSRYAREAGLTSRNRIIAEAECKAVGLRTKAWIAKDGHPRGMLGKKHTPETLVRLGEASLEMWAALSTEQRQAQIDKKYHARLLSPKPMATHESGMAKTWKAGWREIGGKRSFYRSRWEANYARVLQHELEQGTILSWEHEPDRFQFTNHEIGCRSYLPDFKVLTSTGIAYHEVKGWLDERSKSIFRLMAAEYPEVQIVVINATWFKANKHYQFILNDWERTKSPFIKSL